MPAFPLLAAKLFPPPHRAGLIARPRLSQKFEDGLRTGRKVTLVCAPAGFGKTTLVVEWLARFEKSAGQTVSWLSLDTSDNDLGLFLRYLIAAIQSAHPEVGRMTRDLLDGMTLLPAETLLLPLLNDLLCVTTPFVLVLDDYHSLQDPVIHQALAFFLDRQPACMHTIITTRQDPLLPLSRWRARGQLTEFRLGDLRFNEAEAASFLNQSMGLNLLPTDITALEERTEGWIAGLQMAAIAIQQTGQEDRLTAASEFIQSFTGDDRFIMDYLMDEVLQRQPPDVQEFLLKTSVLERFNVSLCQAVLGEAQGELINPAVQLAHLEQANLFLIPLDNRREWFRYHHLFADLLRHRLKTSAGSAHLAALQRRASLWCDENELADQAIAYAQAAGDWELSCKLVLEYSPLLFRQGEVKVLLRWLRSIPDAVIRQDPFMCRTYACTLTSIGLLTAALEYFQLAEEGFSNSPDDLGCTLILASNNALFRGNFQEQILLARRGLGLLAPDNTWLRGTGLLSLGSGLLQSADLEAAEPALLAGFEAGQQANSIRTCVNALDSLGRICILGLDFGRAESFFQRSAHYLVDGRPSPGCDLPLFDLAMLKYEQNDLEQAMEFVLQGLEANQRSGSVEMGSYGLRIAARLHQLQGNAAEAKKYLQQALQMAEDFDLSPLSLSLNAMIQVEMALTDGDVDQAGLAAPRVTDSRGNFCYAFYPETARVHYWIVQGNQAEALKLLEPAMAKAERPGWEYARLHVRLLQALAAAEPSAAEAYLHEALALAQPAGALRTFLDLGEPMRVLLRDHALQLADPLLKSFALKLMALFPAVLQKSGPAEQFSTNSGLVEPLSEREIEVLRLIADGLSNGEIAQKLYLSTNTLKAHTQNIYAKLDVHSRVQAVNRARELNIV